MLYVKQTPRVCFGLDNLAQRFWQRDLRRPVARAPL